MTTPRAKIGWGGPFERTLSLRAQHQAVALFVWLTGAVFFAHCLKYWHPWHFSDMRAILPILHFFPWLVAIFERRRYKTTWRARPESELAAASEQLIVRLLWINYVVIVIFEYVFAK
jgi:hypothetical protein